ncbi:hypothetical protein DH2020_020155 [Rehmannia glutinosa]|uniref:NADP-dependent oxidoreductase domain-containing protein n=1 Tax=Rehmannia glutinosa TaxID=99300 RepID=A0ABR0WFA5_REHGL
MAVAATSIGGLVPRIKLGAEAGLEVSKMGLGCVGMSATYGPPKPEPEMINLIHHAVDSGVTFFDTSDFYGPHTNEILLGKVLKGGMRKKVQLATKFGVRLKDDTLDIRGDPEYVRDACEASLKRLNTDYIDLYYVHRIDTQVPIEVTVCLSEASASTIKRAHAVHPLTAVETEWSLWTRDLEEEVVPTCRELAIGIVAYSPLGRGFLAAGPSFIQNLSETDFRKGCTPAQLALAWVLTQGDDVCPIPGTTKMDNLDQNIGAFLVELSREEKTELESYASADVVKGERHAFMSHTWMNSETPALSNWRCGEINNQLQS